MPAKQKKPSVEEIIQRAVAAQRIAGERQTQDAYKATERRLYAYPVIKLKIANDREFADSLLQHGAPGKSKSVVKYRRSGMRLSPEEIADALSADVNAEIAGDEQEIETIDKALKIIEGDYYADIIRHKYFDGWFDDEIADAMNCDARTVRRNKTRLVSRLAVFLYGKAAVL